MGAIKTWEDIFHFSLRIFVKISAVAGVMFIIIGSSGLFFGQQSDGKDYYFLVCALAGYLILIAVSFFGLETMNQKEIKSPRSLKGE